MKKIISCVLALILIATSIVTFDCATVYGEDVNRNELGLNIVLESNQYIYTGQEIKPTIKVYSNENELEEDVDYIIGSYENNINVGTATINIKGINEFEGIEEKAEFTIASVNLKEMELNLESRGETYLTLSWIKDKKATGYEIYHFNEMDEEWQLLADINNKDSYKVTNLEGGTEYQFKIRPYIKDAEGVLYYGEFSEEAAFTTKPSKSKITGLSTNVKMQLKIKWSKQSCDGFQVRVSRSSKFTNPSTYTIKSSSTLNKDVKAGKNNIYYYVKVRAYKYENGKRIYGLWSESRKIKADGTGWLTSSNRKYYYKNGKPLKGAQRIGGNPYYFGKNTGVLVGSSLEMYNNTKKQTSKTKYLIAVSRTQNRVCVYHKSRGEWVVKSYWKCTTGAPTETAKISRTPKGVYEVPAKRTHSKYFGDKNGYRCWYTTRIHNGYLFHSVLYQPYSSTRIQDGRLGYNLSHGCIRLHKDNAYWLYKNIDAGTKVVIL